VALSSTRRCADSVADAPRWNGLLRRSHTLAEVIEALLAAREIGEHRGKFPVGGVYLRLQRNQLGVGVGPQRDRSRGREHGACGGDRAEGGAAVQDIGHGQPSIVRTRRKRSAARLRAKASLIRSEFVDLIVDFLHERVVDAERILKGASLGKHAIEGPRLRPGKLFQQPIVLVGRGVPSN
jgi:hypothetical protein